MNRLKGFSLIEFMIAIALGMLLIATVIQIFLSSKIAYLTHDALARAQESGRIANEFLARDIRMAGYVGCASRRANNLTSTLNSAANIWYRFDTAIEGLDVGNETGSATLPGDITLAPAPVAGTDMLILRGAFNGSIPVVSNNSGAQLFAAKTSTDADACSGATGYSGLCAGDLLVISDCAKARVFQATNLVSAGTVVNIAHSNAGTATPGNASASWGGNSAPDGERFGTDSEIMHIATVVYYIAVNPATGRAGLWRSSGNSTPVELVEGVVNMQVLYGRDSDGDAIPDQYATATSISNAGAWGQVLGVRVQLLVQSANDNMVPDPQPYTFYGTTVTPTDRRLRYMFVATTGMRSHLK